jgi:ElaB/YqjD/DUF883 family membrane-anchored ribosome-binding protein
MDNDANDPAAARPKAAKPAAAAATIVPQFALDAANTKIAALSAAVIETADSIDRLVGSESLPMPDAMRDLAASTTRRLRDLGSAAGEQDTAELVAKLQRNAAAHPAASIGLGAAIGATLAALLVQLGKSDEKITASAHEDQTVRVKTNP